MLIYDSSCIKGRALGICIAYCRILIYSQLLTVRRKINQTLLYRLFDPDSILASFNGRERMGSDIALAVG